jgi:hypothetical protein
MGIAFHSFAHDHNSKFPMAVPASAGGSLEFVQNGNRAGRDFFFAFRHLQVLSNELATPKILVCASDTRRPAQDFASFKNENLSYFVGVTAEYSRPDSILAGDRNLTNDWLGPGTILRSGPNAFPRWTQEMHRFKGNLLFAGGQVEEKNGVVLTSAGSQATVTAELALPSVPAPGGGHLLPRGPTAAGAPPDANVVRSPMPNAGVGEPATTSSSSTGRSPRLEATSGHNEAAVSMAGPQESSSATVRLGVGVQATNSSRATGAIAGANVKSDFLRFGAWVAGVMESLLKKGMWALYFLLLLIILSAILLRRGLGKRNRKSRNETL